MFRQNRLEERAQWEGGRIRMSTRDDERRK
jgi:hypothetical protein